MSIIKEVVKVNVVFDNEYMENTKMPRLKVIEDNSETGLFIYPFRGYKMQVTTEDGTGDYGSTEVIGFANILKGMREFSNENSNSSIYGSNRTREGMFKEIIKSITCEALIRYAGTMRGKVGSFYYGFNNQEQMEYFADGVLTWLDNKIQQL